MNRDEALKTAKALTEDKLKTLREVAARRSSSMGEVLREWALEKSSVHHRLGHDNPHLRTEHIASSAAYRELASEIDALLARLTEREK